MRKDKNTIKAMQGKTGQSKTKQVKLPRQEKSTGEQDVKQISTHTLNGNTLVLGVLPCRDQVGTTLRDSGAK